MRVIYIITTAHPYDDVRVTHRLGRSFVKNGFDVTWFGPAPKSVPHSFHGIRFIFFKNNANKFDRLTSGIRLKQVLQNQVPADVYFAVDPDSAKIANYFARKFGKKSVFDIHEIFHKDMLLLHNVNKHIVPIIGAFIKRQIISTCKDANLVIGVGETRLNPYLSVIQKALIVRHCVPRDFAKNIQAKPLNKNAREVLIMQGKISQQQGTLKLLIAAKTASQKTGIKVKIVLFKIFSKDLPANDFSKFIQHNNLDDNYILLDPVEFEFMFPLLAKCDIGAIGYQEKMGKECMPNRVFEYMSVGLPVLVPTYAVEMKSIIDTYRCGISANMEDSLDIADKISDLISNPEKTKTMAMNGKNAFIDGCNWEEESRRLLEWIKEA